MEYPNYILKVISVLLVQFWLCVKFRVVFSEEWRFFPGVQFSAMIHQLFLYIGNPIFHKVVTGNGIEK